MTAGFQDGQINPNALSERLSMLAILMAGWSLRLWIGRVKVDTFCLT